MVDAPGTEGETEQLRRRVAELETERQQAYGSKIGGRSPEAIDADLKKVHEELSIREPQSAPHVSTSAGAVPPDAGPLQPVDGRFVHLADLLALRLAGGDPFLSAAVFEALGRAAADPRGATADGRPAITLDALLTAMLRTAAEADRSGRTWISASEFVLDWLRARAPDVDERLAAASPDPPPRPEEVLVAPETTAVLADAARIVRSSHLRQRRIDVRHVMAALLLDPRGRLAVSAQHTGTTAFEDFFRELVAAFVEHVVGQATQTERKAAWRDMFAELPARLLPEPPSPPPLAAYLPDAASGVDAIGVAADVRAMAELICLKETKPPLSIGLFGDWGSGKSFFMDLLAREIEALTEGQTGAEGLFVDDVVQIRFNAWTYADSGNLWASLTAEVFDQLRDGGFRRSARANYGRLVGEIARRVLRSDEQAAGLKQTRDDMDTALAGLREREKSLEAERATPAGRMLAGESGNRLDRYLETHREEIGRLGAVLGRPDLAEDVRAVAAIVNDAQGIPGRVRLIVTAAGRALRHPLRWRRRAYGATALGAVSAVGLASAPQLAAAVPHLTTAWSYAVATLPALGSAGLFAMQAWRLLKPANALARTFRTEVDSARRQAEDDLAALRTEIAAIEKARERAEAERAARQAEAARYADGARGRSPAEVLHFLLHEADEVREVKKHLGLVSTVRRCFETLATIMTEPRPENPPPDAPPHIDRIVLYIDDLDRCRDEQVVQVLEALHLLLAFELFVVVVGVDARWLEGSLGRFYKDQLAGPVPTAAAEGDGTASPPDRATVSDYLEKIFQIAFWLPRLEPGATGSYARLVAQLVGPDVEPETTEGDGDGDEERPPAPDGGDGRTTIEPVEAVMPETQAEARGRIRLTRAELELMQELGPLAGKSPRATKRFVNLYRLIRVSRHGPALERFLNGTADEGPDWPLVMLLLALEVGVPQQRLNGFNKWVETNMEYDSPNDFDEEYHNFFYDISEESTMSVLEVTQISPKQIFPPQVKRLRDEVRRYSFHRAR